MTGMHSGLVMTATGMRAMTGRVTGDTQPGGTDRHAQGQDLLSEGGTLIAGSCLNTALVLVVDMLSACRSWYPTCNTIVKFNCLDPWVAPPSLGQLVRFAEAERML